MFVANVVHFVRLLRRAGLPVGPDRTLAALAALDAVGLERRDDVRAALAAVLLDRHEQQHLFDAAFDAFWCDPKLVEQTSGLPLPGLADRAPPPHPNRLAEALAPLRTPPERPRHGVDDEQRAFDATLTFSDRERLQRADFGTMTTAEFALARRLAAELPPPIEPVVRRRHERVAGRRPHSRIDLRATLQAMPRQPATLLPAWSRPRREWPTLVALLDISGSMDRYARLLLHYLHGLGQRGLRVHTLTFGTRLTDITRSLRHRDPDLALQHAAAQVHDWRGGTRIATCLDDFNRHWARRLLGANAALLLLTDGLDRDERGDLARSAAQLGRLAHRVVWLNPLLRYDRFEPRAEGIRAILPHVDRFLPVHNLASLADLGRALKAGPIASADLRGSEPRRSGPSKA